MKHAKVNTNQVKFVRVSGKVHKNISLRAMAQWLRVLGAHLVTGVSFKWLTTALYHKVCMCATMLFAMSPMD